MKDNLAVVFFGFQGTDAEPSRAVALEELLNKTLFVVVVIVGTFVLSLLLRRAIRASIAWLARRAVSGKPSMWLARIPRVAAESNDVATLRREQRINAASLMVSRILTVILWVLAVFVILAGLSVDVVWALSSAGFLGAAIAIGGQHSVHDYLNGMHILLEDRFGEGDLLEVHTPGGEVRRGTVERLGTFSTRLKSDSATWHYSNRLLAEVRNLSQTSTVIEVGISVAQPVASGEVERAMKRSLDVVQGTEGTGVASVIVDKLEVVSGGSEAQHEYKIRARTNTPLDTGQHEQLAREVASRLDS